MSQTRPPIPAPEVLRALPADGGPGWNRLVFELSPYLQQHAANPVDWFPWGPEAFAKAAAEDKPVLLSVGYATCHWCHVMERECFEDPECAAVMNEHVVCIKVDREERPDIDHIYMQVTLALNGQGGWPMTVLMTPDKEPFFAGTYYPKYGVHGRPGMMDLIPAIAHAWKEDRERIRESAEQITSHLRSADSAVAGATPGPEIIHQAAEELIGSYDPEHGGFGGGRNKFPTPHNLMFLLRAWERTRKPLLLKAVTHTLRAMRLGGIHDHFGFGFHRYSTDREWLLPHFEKMLYDQAMLLMAYAEGHAASGDPLFRQTACEIAEYLARDLRHPDGGFYSAEDADSEGEEGRFYIWSTKELNDLLGEADAKWVADRFLFEPHGNFRDEATGAMTGMNIPHLGKPLDQAEAERWEPLRKKLLEHRAKRPRPLLDDKVLTDWNGLMIAALARAGSLLDDKRMLLLARQAADFVLRELLGADGRLLKRWRNGTAGLPAHLEDYAYLAWGLLELYQARFNPRDLQAAAGLADVMIREFRDEERGGFFQTSSHSETVILRTRELYDGAAPSGNSVAAYALLMLARLTGDMRHESIAQQVFTAFGRAIQSRPSAFTMALTAFDWYQGPGREIVITGPAGSAEADALLSAARSVWQPRAVVLRVTPEDAERLAEVSEFATRMAAQAGGEAKAYVCEGFACRQPVTTPEKLRALLAESGK